MSGAAKPVIVGTAGHIDHGKTSLVEALTGVNTDRWEEERRRGITIDIGFARLDLDDGPRLGFIDVPGHERFVKNMLAGAAGVDLVLLVIAADESVMPQTREHFEICRLLGVERGVVALTKSDLVESDLLELAAIETAEMVEGTFLEAAPVVAVSAKTGAGLGELKAALRTQAAAVAGRDASRRFRLPIDRVFVKKGFGTVVTGTLIAGSISVDDEVEIHPLGRRARVRGARSHDEAVASLGAGRRAALNLAGVDADRLRRGMVLTEPGVFEPVDTLDCRVELLPAAPALKNGAPVHFHLGADEIEAKLYWLERDPRSGARRRSMPPGSTGFARLRLAEPTVALPGDRFVIRRFSPVTTIGGGRVLDNHPPRREARAEVQARLETLDSGERGAILAITATRARNGLSVAEIISRTGWTDRETAAAVAEAGLLVARESPLWVIAPAWIEAAEKRTLQALQRFHEADPRAPGESREALRGLFPGAAEPFLDLLFKRLIDSGRIEVDADLVRLADRRPRLSERERQARAQILKVFAEAGLAAPTLKEFLRRLGIEPAAARRVLENLIREGLLVKANAEMVFHADSIRALTESLARRKTICDRISVAEFKDLAGVSRKYAIPLLEYLDRRRITYRAGDERLIR